MDLWRLMISAEFYEEYLKDFDDKEIKIHLNQYKQFQKIFLLIDNKEDSDNYIPI